MYSVTPHSHTCQCFWHAQAGVTILPSNTSELNVTHCMPTAELNSLQCMVSNNQGVSAYSYVMPTFLMIIFYCIKDSHSFITVICVACQPAYSPQNSRHTRKEKIFCFGFPKNCTKWKNKNKHKWQQQKSMSWRFHQCCNSLIVPPVKMATPFTWRGVIGYAGFSDTGSLEIFPIANSVISVNEIILAYELAIDCASHG